ncbi:MAG: NAD-dependent deacylase [Candidatus Atribacteria bacterium]|nr:NAD-dependent deacylase [Candidatus Atribacteria bacterium]
MSCATGSKELISHTAEFLLKNKPWLVLTGAGVSTESGIPDFRSPGSGLWQRYDPMEVLSTDTLFRDPETFYRVGFYILRQFKHARPNLSHYLLAEWEKRGLVHTLVTQNIDSLHTISGSQRVLEIHGHLRTAHCMRCEKTVPLDRVEKEVDGGEIPPKCQCGGVLRPDVVLFGDLLPSCFEEAMEFARRMPLLVIGSSLQVSPANFIPFAAHQVVIVNIGVTPFDARSDYVLNGKASEILRGLNEEMKKQQPTV